MTGRISQTQARQIASRLVGTVYPFGGQYCFNYKSGHPSRMWSTSHPTDYFKARSRRKELVDEYTATLFDGEDAMGRKPPEWFYDF